MAYFEMRFAAPREHSKGAHHLKSLSILFVILLLSLPLACTKQPTIPCCTRIGDFALANKDILESDIVDKYGQGVDINNNRESDDESRAHIYFDPFQKLWIRFDATSHGHDGAFVIEEIFVSVVPFAKDTVFPKSRFSRFVTENNICVGLKESQVVKLLGRPFRIDDAAERETRDSRFKDEPGYGSVWGSKVLVYQPEGDESLLQFRIHVDQGIVRSLTLSCSE